MNLHERRGTRQLAPENCFPDANSGGGARLRQKTMDKSPHSLGFAPKRKNLLNLSGVYSSLRSLSKEYSECQEFVKYAARVRKRVIESFAVVWRNTRAASVCTRQPSPGVVSFRICTRFMRSWMDPPAVFQYVQPALSRDASRRPNGCLSRGAVAPE